MENPLDRVPLNTKSQFVMGTTKDGCEIYMPVDDFDPLAQAVAKKELKEHLNEQDTGYTPPSAA